MNDDHFQGFDPLIRLFPDAFGDRKKGIPGQIIDLPKSTAYHYMKQGLLPKPIHVGKNSFCRFSKMTKAIKRMTGELRDILEEVE